MSIYPPRVKRFIKKGVIPHDAEILSEMEENYTYGPGDKAGILSFNEKIKFYEQENRKQMQRFGVPIDKADWWEEHYGPSYYKINKNGKVTLVWSGIMEFGFAYLKKIPHNLLDLSDLRYLDLMCEVKKEAIPETFNRSKKFEIKMIYAGEWRANAWSMKNWRENKPIIVCNHTAFEMADKSSHIDLDNFFELTIYRKDLVNYFKEPPLWDRLFEEAFKKE